MKGRTLAATAAMCLVLTPASAQDALPSAALQSGLPSASLQTRLPSAGLPRRTSIVPLRRPRTDVFRAAPQTFAPTFDEPLGFDPRFFPFGGAFVGGPFFVPGFFPGVVHVPGFFPGFANAVGPFKPSWARRSSLPGAPAGEWLGYLRLVVEPDTAQVYVDGFYVGTVADLRGLVTLEPGPHRVELRAPGYDTVAFDVRVFPTETITYRTALQPSAPAEKPAPPAPGTPKAFYVIPNCYAGDRPPDRSALPRTCDIAKLRTIPPVVK
ncbi:MAG: PEGA domain-containing protein [Acidobacteria bacterium]|nr:PEGA domain-containing protein [Acidobacteriota bacterium]